MNAKAIAFAALLALPASAGAQVAAPAGPAAIASPLQDLQPDNSFSDRAARLWSGVVGMFDFQLGSGDFVRSNNAALRQQAREDFTWLMGVAGYKLKEIETAVSIVPSLSLTFGHARELTEGDRDHLDRMLIRHARQYPGPLAAIQRTIVRGIVDASEIGGFTVDKVEVDLFPLPKVKLVMTPTDAPLGVEASRIMRAIERLNQRVQTIAPRPQGQGFEFNVPQGAPLRPASIDY
ncbi:hypothetical protein [Falsiroseomonas stagni]|uniref:Uncharacterized protein n=1 Tax=Falsiroseomonas stagni DSM 19981 TaxID=1123062 RepID=A0A1I4FEJ0_9PROT|nr:hypothetical protein [Falsiroseomonas stagni]SFL16338.1 hypothetical protein SAMN02745775_1314 [Falsiroseomonas stagni DSM 19981]